MIVYYVTIVQINKQQRQCVWPSQYYDRNLRSSRSRLSPAGADA